LFIDGGAPFEAKICSAPDRDPNAETNPGDPSPQVIEALPKKPATAWAPENVTR
jgi:hypothetical protein